MKEPTGSRPTVEAAGMEQEFGAPVAMLIAPHKSQEPLDPATADGVPRGPARPRSAHYDREFEAAIVAGHLTIHDAIVRGSRRAQAARLQRRHDLSPEVALQVADNRVPLHAALKGTDREEEALAAPVREVAGPVRSRRVAIGLLFGGAVLAVGLVATRQWAPPVEIDRHIAETMTPVAVDATVAPPAETRASAASPAQIERDELGRATRVSAGHPSSALDAVCRLASSSDTCAWMELRRLDPHHPGHRIGRFTVPSDGGTIHVALIRRDRSSGRWLAGNGLRPLAPGPADGGPLVQLPQVE
jgi:hypothetical protein